MTVLHAKSAVASTCDVGIPIARSRTGPVRESGAARFLSPSRAVRRPVNAPPARRGVARHAGLTGRRGPATC